MTATKMILFHQQITFRSQKSTQSSLVDELTSKIDATNTETPDRSRKATKCHVYKRRWYILFVFGMMSMTQCSVYNTFSPIADVGERVFGWNTATLSLIANWGPIAYVVGTFGFSWILDEKVFAVTFRQFVFVGLRPACMLSSFFTAVGCGFRCISSQAAVATPLIHLGQFISGLAGPIAMGAPPALSSEWFPTNQRTTATSLAFILNSLGMAVSFLLGPYLVPVMYLQSNFTGHETNSSLHFLSDEISTSNLTNSAQVYDVQAERDALMRYMYYSFGWSLLCLLLYFTYFPSKPPLPPSPTASMLRLEFKTGLKNLLRNRSFWLICFTYGLSQGVLGVWTGILDVNLKDHDISQNEAAWLGFYGTIATCTAAFIIARGTDIFARHMKWIIIALFFAGGGCFLVFALILVKIVSDSEAVIYSIYVLASFLLGATSPIFFEIACEVTYPVAEGVTNLVLTLANNIAGLLFLLVQLIPNIGTMWENWCLIGSIFVCVPIMFLLKERYNRLDIDLTIQKGKQKL